LAFKPWNIEAYWRLCHLIFVSHLFKWWCWRALLDLVGSQWFVIRLRRGIMWFHSHCWYSISMYIPVLAGRIPICLGRIPTNISFHVAGVRLSSTPWIACEFGGRPRASRIELDHDVEGHGLWSATSVEGL
jgi:hypothetical protein